MVDSPRHIVIGTAGHIDHGKSSLVNALTGTDPDRLPEEQERGITIDLGFAHSVQSENLIFSFVDVPGHERFVKNMLAGAGGVDLVLLVIAADESVMPQTREHFHICRLLGAKHGVVALTKTDMVDEEMVELVRLEVEELIDASFLEGAAIVPVSSTTGDGLEDLRVALREVVSDVPPRPADGPFRIPVDRVFTIKGFGTVITGTSLSGSVRDGDTLAILPYGGKVKVRGIQVHGGSADTAAAGQRVALNLQGVGREEVHRGDWLATPDRYKPSSMLDADLEMLSSAPAPLLDMDRVRFHVGAREVLARVRVLEPGSKIPPGGSGLVQIRMEAPLHAVHGEHFVVRRYSPVTTVGGGRILDPAAPKRSAPDPSLDSHFEALRSASLERVLGAWIESSSVVGIAASDLADRTGWSASQQEAALAALASRGTIVRAGDRWFPSASWGELLQTMDSTLDQFHRKNPLAPGMSASELRASIGVDEETYKTLLEVSIANGTAGREGDRVFSTAHKVVLTAEEEQAQKSMEEQFRTAGLTPPEEKAVLQQHHLPRAREIYQILLDEGRLLRLKGGYVFHKDALRDLEKLVLDGPETFKVPEFKERTGTTRKHAIPLLEYLDGRNVTLRAGDVRRVVQSRGN